VLLNIKIFAFVCATLWGLGVFLMTWFIILRSGVTGEKTLIGRVYLGYSVSPRGSLVGFFWGFVDGLISGALLAWIYNAIASKFIG